MHAHPSVFLLGKQVFHFQFSCIYCTSTIDCSWQHGRSSFLLKGISLPESFIGSLLIPFLISGPVSGLLVDIFYSLQARTGTGWFDKLSEADRAKIRSLTSTPRLIGEENLLEDAEVKREAWDSLLYVVRRSRAEYTDIGTRDRLPIGRAPDKMKKKSFSQDRSTRDCFL
jgi:hypothetical protein